MYKKAKACIICGNKFYSAHPNYLTCSKECCDINKVNKRYQRTNNDWKAYFKHLLSKKLESSLTPDQLIHMIADQNYRCALSGVELTCIHIRGKVIQTNASIDRSDAGKEYNYNNIQIVCRAVNSFRGDMTINEFINWCTKVANNAILQRK